MPKRKSSLFLISAAACFSYLPVLFFKLTYFDDHIAVLTNQSFLLKWSNFFVAFQRDVLSVFGGGAGYYRPFGIFTLIWDAHWSGINPFSYHLTNVILHALVSCVVYLVLTQISKIEYPIHKDNKGYYSGGNDEINLILALLFAVHPLSVQVVAWIPGRGESILALVILLSFYFFLPGNRRFIPHQFFFLCALFTKESAVVFSVILGLYDFICRWVRPLRRLAVWKYYLGWFFCVIFFLFIRHSVVSSLAFGMTVKDILLSVVNNLPGIFLYVGKIFLPVNLSVLPILRDSNLVIGEITAVIIFWVFLAAKKVARHNFAIMVFGLIWFLTFLLPSFIYPDLNSFPGFLEQRAYLPMIGVLLILQGALAAFRPLWEKYKNIFRFLTIVMILLFLSVTVMHSLNFRDRLVFWKRAVRDSPHSAFAHKNLGAMFYLDDNLQPAGDEFKKAYELNPRETMVHNNLGLIFMRAGKFAEAEGEFQEELRINPAYDNVHYNYALLKYRQGKPEEAVALWEKTVALNPGYADAWRALVALAIERNDREKAQMYLDKAAGIGLDLKR